jgi:hypothetical protein
LPLYEFQCPTHGKIIIKQSMQAASMEAACSVCALPSKRIFSVPRLITAPMFLRDEWREIRSRDEVKADHAAYEKSYESEAEDHAP